MEVFAIWWAIRTLGRRQESGRRYTVFVDSTSTIDRVRTDAIGLGQRFAITAMEAYGRILTRDNELTIRWIPAHHGAQGNKVADENARTAASRSAPCSNGDDGVRRAPVGGLPLTHGQDRHRGQVARHGGVDRQPRRHPPVQAPSGERPPPPAPARRQEGVGREVLPVPLRPHSDWVVSQGQGTESRLRQVLLVRHR